MKEMHGKPHAQSHRNYEMEVASQAENISPNQPINITYKIKSDSGNTLSAFEVTHEKIMHLISIRKDLQHFQHLHPNYNSITNEFSVYLSFPADGSYRLFADFTPSDDDSMKQPVTAYTDLSVGNHFDETPLEVDQSNTKTADGYQITYLFPDELKKQEEVTYTLEIEKDGTPVDDLEDYLGAKGHSVIIRQGTLDYVHTHALEGNQSGHEDHSMGHQGMHKNTDNKANKIDFATSFPEAGLYKIFTQFKNKGKVIATDYVVKVN